MQTGRVILLNGTSSAGKTSLARALQHVLDEEFLLLAIDDFVETMVPPRCKEEHYGVSSDVTRRMLHGFHHSIGAFVRTGNHVIIDHVLLRPEWVESLSEALGEAPACCVKVSCPLEVLEAREKERGDRPLGLARSQVSLVHQFLTYDLALNTAQLSSEEGAACIRDGLAKHGMPRFAAHRKEPLPAI